MPPTSPPGGSSPRCAGLRDQRRADHRTSWEKRFRYTRCVVIDISRGDEVNGALIGALLRASRRLAWRNRRLKIVCEPMELRRRLQIAGLDELADGTHQLDPS